MSSSSKQATPYQPLNGCMCQDGNCESCNRVVEAWEVMREALYLVDVKRSLALADEAAKGKP